MVRDIIVVCQDLGNLKQKTFTG